MKFSVTPILAGVLISLLLPSCVIHESGGYVPLIRSQPPTAYRSVPYGHGSAPYYGPVPYRSAAYGSSYGHHGNHYRGAPYRRSISRHGQHYGHAHHGQHYGHKHHGQHGNQGKKNLKHHPNSYRIVGGSTGKKVKPKGYHSIGWYKSRGYDVNRLRLQNEQGKSYRSSRKRKR